MKMKTAGIQLTAKLKSFNLYPRKFAELPPQLANAKFNHFLLFVEQSLIRLDIHNQV